MQQHDIHLLYLFLLLVVAPSLAFVTNFRSSSCSRSLSLHSQQQQQEVVVRSSGVVRFPRVEIEFCTGCKWMLRAAYLQQELLSTFGTAIGEIALIPCATPSGRFIVRVNECIVWDRTQEATKGFPETKVLKQLVRDIIEPEKSLGHSDKVIEVNEQ